MYTIGMRPGEVYTQARFLRGACPNPGTRGIDSSGREFILLRVGASQNLTNGMAVTYSVTGTGYNTVLGTAAGAGAPDAGAVAIVYCSITASTSSFVWAQIYGNCATAIMGATASALPGKALKFGADGTLTAVGVVTTSQYISGLTCTATNSVQDSPVAAVFLNYPRVVGP
jgi:hypothetical protein